MKQAKLVNDMWKTVDLGAIGAGQLCCGTVLDVEIPMSFQICNQNSYRNVNIIISIESIMFDNDIL